MSELPAPTDAYRLIYFAQIEQLSPLSIGGTAEPGGFTQAVCRDGAGRLILKGDAIAGALVATSRKLTSTLPKKYTLGAISTNNTDKEVQISCWCPEHSHTDNAQLGLRAGVEINPQTGASEENSVFNTQVIETGTVWPLIITVELDQDPDYEVAALIGATLTLWQQGFGWIGAQASRGLGHFKLNALKAYYLDKANYQHWPDATQSPLATIQQWQSKYFAQNITQQSTSIVQYSDIKPWVNHWLDLQKERGGDESWWVMDNELILMVNSTEKGKKKANDEDVYGYDPFAITQEVSLLAHDLTANMLLPSQMTKEQFNHSYFQPDKTIVTDSQGRPLITAPAIRSTIKRAIIAFAQYNEQQLHDWFGFVDGSEVQSGCTYPQDAILADDNYQLAWLHGHAEDEFCAGAYESNKYDKTIVLAGAFVANFRLEAPNQDQCKAFEQVLKQIEPFLAIGLVMLGSGASNGLGAVKWQFKLANTQSYLQLLQGMVK